MKKSVLIVNLNNLNYQKLNIVLIVVTKIDENAHICPDCGVNQPGYDMNQQLNSNTYQQTVYQLKNPGIAAVLSAFFVGFGQIYNGQIAKGLVFMLFYLVSIVLIFVIIGFITTPILWIYGIYDAYNTAKRINSGEIHGLKPI